MKLKNVEEIADVESTSDSRIQESRNLDNNRYKSTRSTSISSSTDDRSSESSNMDPSIYYIDPSEHFRPEHKSAEEYRIYTTNQDDYIQKRVFETYRLMHKNQVYAPAL